MNTLTHAASPGWLSAAETPMVIAGPCSAETEEQLTATALPLAQMGVRVLRAGIWKPRTRPNSFEGVGEPALVWLQNVRRLTGMEIMVEVANARHVEQALQANVDRLWIGARTTVNPFAVQEIADALREAGKPVLVKNPINPDVGLWLGALERLAAAGVPQLAACHRGFSYYGQGRYRNAPQWEAPLEIRRLAPELPLLCDPSHIAGKRDLVPEIAQKALNFGFDGLMIETHHDPIAAWSDAEQQLSPAQLQELLARLVVPAKTTDNDLFRYELEKMRAVIDEIDGSILDFIGRRMNVARQIGKLKSENDAPFFQLDRWREVFRSRTEQAQKLNLSEGFITQFLQLLHTETLEQHH